MTSAKAARAAAWRDAGRDPQDATKLGGSWRPDTANLTSDQQLSAWRAALKPSLAAAMASIGFALGLEIGWYGRGANAVEKRRRELRAMATTRIAAIEAAAIGEPTR